MSSLVRAEFGALSHPGLERANNQDHYLIMKVGRDQQTLLTNVTDQHLPQSFKEWGYLMCVADGMGEGPGGEVASSLALSTALQLALRFGRWNLRIDDEIAEEVIERGRWIYNRINAVLAERADLNGMTASGTTLAIAFSAGNELFVAHVGDSRAYLLRSGKLYRLTHDQTYAQLLADTGQIRQEQVDRHHLRHVLTEAMGVGEGELDVQLKRLQLDDADCVLLCTDGLTEMVEEDQIINILLGNENPQTACEQLVNAALENGGSDNVTVLVGRYSIPT